MTTVNNAHRRTYTLKVWPVTYGVFLLQEADWFDDGICFCGPMVHHAYAMRDGCPVRYSLLPGGAVKKAQVLGGDGLRLMAFEWTHLGCSRAIYERLTLNGLRRMPHPVEGSLAWALKYAGADRVTAAAEAGSGADPFADWRRADGYSLLEWQARHDAGTLPRSVNRLMEAAPDAWAETVLDHAAHLRPELGTALALRLARRASHTHDDALAQRLLDGLADIPLSDPTAVAAAVRELREGEAGSDWCRQRREALESLAKRPPGK